MAVQHARQQPELAWTCTSISAEDRLVVEVPLSFGDLLQVLHNRARDRELRRLTAPSRSQSRSGPALPSATAPLV